jgi:L-Ala-D/L-Glu epimerase
MQLQIHSFQLQLKDAFTISRGTRYQVDNVIVALSENGFTGYGEATANPYYHTTAEGMTLILEGLRSKIEAYRGAVPADFWNYLLPELKDRPFVHCALDVAMHDLVARKAGKQLYDYWGLKPGLMPLTNYTIGLDDVSVMLEKMKKQPWPIYKIKLGTANDLQIVKTLRQHSDAIFRVDANCGWTAEETIILAPELKALGVEWIEQPLPAEDVEGMKAVFAQSVLPIFADESCCVEADVDRCKDLFHGINIKLMKCGGLTPALRMIEKARVYGLKVMVGCMTESSVGISAIAHLLPLLDYVDMDGALLLANDPARGVRIEQGRVFFAEEFGTGAGLV